jgi:hypothetical protein
MAKIGTAMVVRASNRPGAAQDPKADPKTALSPGLHPNRTTDVKVGLRIETQHAMWSPPISSHRAGNTQDFEACVPVGKHKHGPFIGTHG